MEGRFAPGYRDATYLDYSGKKRFDVSHPAHKGDDLIVAAPGANAAIVAAGDRWGERWTRVEFYAYCSVTERR